MALTNLEKKIAPGAPGIEPRWTSAQKSGVGTALSPTSAVWFTLSHGIVNEVYYPYMDQANIRDMGLIVTDGQGYFCEEKRHMVHHVEWIEKGIPAFRLTNQCQKGRCEITKIVHTDPFRHSLITYVKFKPLIGTLKDYKLFILLAPHIRNCGWGNDAWVDDSKGYPMLFARRHNTGIALGCSTPFKNRSCGYVGQSDGWTDLHAHGQMTWFYTEAPQGNVALIGEIDLEQSGGEFRLVLGFGRGRAESSQQVRGSLVASFDFIYQEYLDGWRQAQGRFLDLGRQDLALSTMYRISLAALETHRSKSQMGSMIASLSIPWGFSKSDNDIGGYHLVWARDQSLSSEGFLAAGDPDTAKYVLMFLAANQEADGHWVQNMWDDGTPYWNAIQMDETALPILLADALHREGVTFGLLLEDMVKKAACFLLREGPTTGQDRWEENGGYTPFTLATEVAALLAAADFFERSQQKAQAHYLREIADAWNESIERWLYVTDTELSQRLGIEGYYVRITPLELLDEWSPAKGSVTIHHQREGTRVVPASQMVSADALALVRFGLRDCNDPKILNTVVAIDALLKKETTTGPVWHRYNGDGYGEQEDGSAFNGMGIGRGWPLLAGERGMYEIARGNFTEARRLLKTMIAQAGPGGFIPEQVWDGEDIPSHRLYNGLPSGSAMPLIWAHSEFIKLLRSLEDKKVYGMPCQTVQRYLRDKVHSAYFVWSFNHPIGRLPVGKQLRIQIKARAKVRWTLDGWATSKEEEARDTGLSVYYLDFSLHDQKKGEKLVFTFFWIESGSWEGKDYTVTLE